MPDREKVIKGIHQHCEGSLFDRCGECPYYDLVFGSWGENKFTCRDELLSDALELLKEQEPYISKETRLNRDEYCRVGDVLDCFDGMDMKADEVFHAVCLIEWAMSKRSVPLDQLLKEQEPTTFNPHYIDEYGTHFICGVECGSCHEKISRTYHYCPYCGKAVKWE